MQETLKKSFKNNYEISGDKIKLNQFIKEIKQKAILLTNNELEVNIDNSISYIKVNIQYLCAALKETIFDIQYTYQTIKINVSIYKQINENLSISICSQIKGFDVKIINQLLINFVTELHNGQTSIEYKNDVLTIIITLPNYRIINS
ncbi:MAG: hypothetical protein ACK4OM_04795 [Alphaproteobacteria bacterium]